MGYFDYTDDFRELITNTNTIIDNQEILLEKETSLLTSINVLVFITVLVFTLSICRKVFRVK